MRSISVIALGVTILFSFISFFTIKEELSTVAKSPEERSSFIIGACLPSVLSLGWFLYTLKNKKNNKEDEKEEENEDSEKKE